jgi:quinol monooxygenase YgiN
MIAYVAELVARADTADRIARLLEDLVRSTASEEGARIYTVHRQVDDPLRFVVYEAYADQAAGDAHMQGGPVQSALQAFGELLAQPPVLRHLRVLDGFTHAAGSAARGLL